VAEGSIINGLYRLLKVVGKGGMGSVYKAEKITTHEILAIKFMNVEFAEDEESMERFRREIETLRSIRHPNVVYIFDWFLPSKGQADAPYVVMEYLEGEPLVEFLKRERVMGVPDTVTVMLQVIDALATAHERGIIHRDMGPQNVFLVNNAENKLRIKLLDFGLAKATDPRVATRDVTRVGTLIGRVTYAAPEHFLARPIDARSDIFSCGMMMVRMLTGNFPYKESSVTALLAERLKDCGTAEEYPSVREMNAGVPPMLEAIVARAIRKKPEDRYQKARDMLLDLSEVEKNLGMVGEPESAYVSKHAEELVRFIDRLQIKVAEKEGEQSRAGDMGSDGEILQMDAMDLPVDIDGEMEADARSVAAPAGADVEQTGGTQPAVTRKLSRKRRAFVVAAAVLTVFFLLIVGGGIAFQRGVFPWGTGRSGGKPGTGTEVGPGPAVPAPVKEPPGDLGPGPHEQPGGDQAGPALPEKVHVAIKGAPKGAVAKMGNQVVQGDALEGLLPRGSNPVVLEVSAPGYVTYVKSIIPDKDLEISLNMAQTILPIETKEKEKEGEATAAGGTKGEEGVEGEKTATGEESEASPKVGTKKKKGKRAKGGKKKEKKEKTIKGKFGTSISTDYEDE
jgi:hypothetical protein